MKLNVTSLVVALSTKWLIAAVPVPLALHEKRGSPSGDILDVAKSFSATPSSSENFSAGGVSDMTGSLLQSEKLSNQVRTTASPRYARKKTISTMPVALKLSQEDQTKLLGPVSPTLPARSEILQPVSRTEGQYYIRFPNADVYSMPAPQDGLRRDLSALDTKQRKEVQRLDQQYKRRNDPVFIQKERQSQSDRRAARQALQGQTPPRELPFIPVIVPGKRRDLSNLTPLEKNQVWKEMSRWYRKDPSAKKRVRRGAGAEGTSGQNDTAATTNRLSQQPEKKQFVVDSGAVTVQPQVKPSSPSTAPRPATPDLTQVPESPRTASPGVYVPQSPRSAGSPLPLHEVAWLRTDRPMYSPEHYATWTQDHHDELW